MKLVALSSALVSTFLFLAACAPPSFTPTATVKVAQSVPGSGAASSCGSWEGWSCQVNPQSPHQCFATCGADKIACNGDQCSKSSSAFGASTCADVHPAKAPSCGDCRAAFDAGCH